MKLHVERHVLCAGIAGALILVAFAGSAAAESKYYPDGTNCSLLSDSELVPCQNQLYTRQLESGASQQAAQPGDQTLIPSSNIEGNNAAQSSDIVPGAETNVPPNAAPVRTPATAPTTLYTLPGPEGTTPDYAPAE